MERRSNRNVRNQRIVHPELKNSLVSGREPPVVRESFVGVKLGAWQDFYVLKNNRTAVALTIPKGGFGSPANESAAWSTFVSFSKGSEPSLGDVWVGSRGEPRWSLRRRHRTSLF